MSDERIANPTAFGAIGFGFAQILLSLYFADILDMNGLGVIAGVKKIRPDIPVVMLTAYKDSSLKRHAMKAGAAAYVTKPFEVNEMLGALGIALKGIPQ